MITRYKERPSSQTTRSDDEDILNIRKDNHPIRKIRRNNFPSFDSALPGKAECGMLYTHDLQTTELI